MDCDQSVERVDNLPPEHNGWENRTNEPEEEYLDWLNPTMAADYIACEVDGKTRARRARERGVAPATVSQNINRARERLSAIYEEQEAEA